MRIPGIIVSELIFIDFLIVRDILGEYKEHIILRIEEDILSALTHDINIMRIIVNLDLGGRDVKHQKTEYNGEEDDLDDP